MHFNCALQGILRVVESFLFSLIERVGEKLENGREIGEWERNWRVGEKLGSGREIGEWERNWRVGEKAYIGHEFLVPIRYSIGFKI